MSSTPVYQPNHMAVTRPFDIRDFAALPPQFEAEFEAVWRVPPNDEARQAYLATRQLLSAVNQATDQFGSPARKNVLRSLADLYN